MARKNKADRIYQMWKSANSEERIKWQSESQKGYDFYLNEQLTKELNLHKMNTDELINVYERVGELVGNTNLPRHEEQLIIEYKKDVI